MSTFLKVQKESRLRDQNEPLKKVPKERPLKKVPKERPLKKVPKNSRFLIKCQDQKNKKMEKKSLNQRDP